MGVGALIGAVIGGAAFAGGSTLFGATLVSSALMGAALGSMFDRRSIDAGDYSPSYTFGEYRNPASRYLPVPVIYGRVKIAGNLIYHRVSDDSKQLHIAVGLGEGPIEAVEQIYVNDIPIEEIEGATWDVYLGTGDQTADARVLTGERWPYTAYIAATFTANEQISDTPTITAVVKGLKVSVWDEEEEDWMTQFSQNPAYCLLDFLRSTRYGVGIPDDRIDFESFIEEAAYCDELVSGPDGNEARFQLDYVLDFQRSSLDVIDDILATFRAYLLYSDGKIRLQIERSRSPVYAFTMDNIVADSFVYSKASYKDIPNQVRIEWIDPDTGWERVEAVYDNEIDQDRRGDVYSRSISLLGVTRPGQAGRMARFYHDSAFWANTFCEFRVGIDALHVEVGDVIQVSHDVPGWENKLFRILEIEEDENDEMTLRCREYVPAIYHDRGVPYQPGKETTLPNPLAPPPHVTNLTAVSASRTLTDGSVVPVIQVTWTEPTVAFYAGAIVYWRKQGDSAWQRSPLVEAPSYDIILTEPGTYEVRVVSESRQGIRAPFATAPEQTVTVSTVIPGNVTGLAVDFDGPDAIATWNPVAHAHTYRVRILDASTDQIKRTVHVTGTTYTYTFAENQADFGVPTPQIKVSLEARNEAGNYSAQPAVVTAVCPQPPQPDVSVKSDRAEVRWTVTSDVPLTWKSTTVAVGTFSQTAPVLAGVIDAESAGLADGQQATVSVSLNDVFGRTGTPRQVTVTVKYIDKLAFVQGLRGVELVSALPELPNPDYPQGSVVFLTTDDKLYRSTGSTWTAEVPTTDLSGTITETQIANAAVTTAKIANAAVEAAKLAEAAVEEAKLATGAVTTEKIAALAVTAAKIAAGAIETAKLAAGAVTTEKLAALAVTAEKIAAGAIEAVKIAAGAVTTEKLAALAVTADKLAANAVTAGKIAAGAVTADAIAANEIGAEHIRIGDPLDRAVKNVNASNLPNAMPEGGTLFHFDHSLMSSRGLRPLPGAVATLRVGEGRFGGAVAVEEATTNLLGTLSPKDGAELTTELTHYTNQPVFYCDGSSSWQGIRASQQVTLTGGNEYTFSVYVYNPSSGGGAVNIQVDSDEVSNETAETFVEVPPGPGWHRIVVTWSPPADRNVVAVRFENMTSSNWQSGSNKCYMTAPQLEAKPFATSFVAGSRAAGSLSYPQLLDTKRGTLSVWINPHYLTNYNNFFEMTISTGRFLLFFENNGRVHWDFGPANWGPSKANAVAAGRWDMHTLTWDADEGVYAYYLNGELVGEETYVEPDSLPSTLRTVTNHNALLDELLVLPFAATAEQIRAWYELQSPFYDAAAATVGGRGAVVIDHTGAWGYDENGNKRAGFGTDGRWIAGGGRISADEMGMRVVDALNNPRLFMGHLAGLPWGTSTLPAGTYGLWGDRAGLYLNGYPKLIKRGLLFGYNWIEEPKEGDYFWRLIEEDVSSDIGEIIVPPGRALVAALSLRSITQYHATNPGAQRAIVPLEWEIWLLARDPDQPNQFKSDPWTEGTYDTWRLFIPYHAYARQMLGDDVRMTFRVVYELYEIGENETS